MNETTPAPLPPPPAPSDLGAVDESRAEKISGLTHPAAIFFAAAAAGVALAIVFGGLIGFGVAAMSASDCSPSDGWCGLGAALIGIFAGVVAGALAYLIAGIVVIHRLRPAGRRAAHVVAHVLAPPLVVIVLGFLGEVTSNIG